jgi:uncharacterized protein GlcG (DUF336 family)
MSVTLEQADSVIAAGKQKAVAIGVPVNIVVMDQGGFLKAFARMDGALLGSIEIAQKRAKTAILFDMNTEAVFEFCKLGAPAFGLEQSNGGLAVFAGGIPLSRRSRYTLLRLLMPSSFALPPVEYWRGTIPGPCCELSSLAKGSTVTDGSHDGRL